MVISLEELSKIFSSAFEVEIVLDMDSSKENMGEWDSLKHLHLILELEDTLNIEFTPFEIEQMTSVVQILTILKEK